MRGKLSEVYTDCDKKTIDGMLLIIVGKKTVWEISNEVLDDMNKARKKEKMKGFLQSEEVKEMRRFAGEVGIRGYRPSTIAISIPHRDRSVPSSSSPIPHRD
ncbi:hypothetical protein LOK49_LG01G00659 [Camellia lanceoleosa]|uniref:Uncharacterized protein n=1 Tax=Camellia lanceoleosa TaxID=1840588 RepID=A0ACC0IWL0_9ERIC|nr:hypothetical protein LOK49_LG01G00659 [Camellia lanceoleosa]